MAVFATLADVKRHANITGTGSDDELSDMLAAASELVAELIGWSDVGEVTESVAVSGGTALLSRRPVVGPVLIGGVAVPEANIRRAAGLLVNVWAGASGSVEVTYTGGPAEVPERVQLATSIIATHLWETQRGSSPSPLALQDGEAPASGRGYALPNRALELLNVRRPQVA